MAAVDIALWDAVAKARGVPVYALLGGHNREIPVVATSPPVHTQTELVVEQVAEAVDNGFRAYKIHPGAVSESDAIRLAHMSRDMVPSGSLIDSTPTRAMAALAHPVMSAPPATVTFAHDIVDRSHGPVLRPRSSETSTTLTTRCNNQPKNNITTGDLMFSNTSSVPERVPPSLMRGRLRQHDPCPVRSVPQDGPVTAL